MVAIVLAARPGRAPAACRCRRCRGRLPDDPGNHALSRRQPGGDEPDGDARRWNASSGRCPASTRMESTSSSGASIVTLQFNLSTGLDVAEQEVQAAINASQALLPADPSGPAGLCQGQPRRRADPDPGDNLRHDPAYPGTVDRRHAAGAEDQPDQRRRPGRAGRRTEARRCGSVRTPRSCRAMA